MAYSETKIVICGMAHIPVLIFIANFIKGKFEVKKETLKETLVKALTHVSKSKENNEVFEFLGDSVLDILVSLYYGGILRYNSKKPNWNKRDKC